MDAVRRLQRGIDTGNVEQGILGSVIDATTLSWSTRLKAFVICLILGLLMSFLGILCFFLGKGVAMFPVIYSLGNLVSLASASFLMGPVNLVKEMFAPTRAKDTVCMVLSVGLTLFAEIILKSGLIALLFCILQFLSMMWFLISFIPYARDFIREMVNMCLR